MYDVIIIGLGAAGISASIFAKRSGLNVLAINYGTPGGIISTSSVVENYPGFMTITGWDLAYEFFKHFMSLNIPFYNEEVIDIKDGSIKEVITKNNVYKAKNIIIASGRIPKKLEVKNADKFYGKGISYCATCDGNLYKNKDVAIIGGGNNALESASYLSNICNKVYMFILKDKLIGSKILIDEVSKKENVEIVYNCSVLEVIGSDKVSGIITNNGEYKLDGIFVSIGYMPSTKILKNLNLKMKNNYIVVDKNCKTSCDGIYACGDIVKKDLYQLVTAVSDGAIAATDIFKNIK